MPLISANTLVQHDSSHFWLTCNKDVLIKENNAIYCDEMNSPVHEKSGTLAEQMRKMMKTHFISAYNSVLRSTSQLLVSAASLIFFMTAQTVNAVPPSDAGQMAPLVMRTTASVGWETHDDWPIRCGRAGQSAAARVVRADLGCVVVDRINQTCTIITDRRSSTGVLGVLFELCSRETR